MTPQEGLIILADTATAALTAYAERLFMEGDEDADRKVATYRDELIDWIERSTAGLIAASAPRVLH